MKRVSRNISNPKSIPLAALGASLFLVLSSCASNNNQTASTGGSSSTTGGSSSTTGGSSSTGGTAGKTGTGGTGVTTGGTGGSTGGITGTGGSVAGTGGSVTGTGGAAGAAAGHGGTSGGSGTGASGAGGTTGTAGSGAAGAPALVVDCGSLNYATILTQDCTTVGCHRPPATAASQLILVPDAGLVSRLKDVPAKHMDIYCPDLNDVCPTVPAACDMTALLVNSAQPDKSWILQKLRGTQNGCGDQMPSPAYDMAKEQCLEKMVNAIAALPK
jgi:hypothetical protein